MGDPTYEAIQPIIEVPFVPRRDVTEHTADMLANTAAATVYQGVLFPDTNLQLDNNVVINGSIEEVEEGIAKQLGLDHHEQLRRVVNRNYEAAALQRLKQTENFKDQLSKFFFRSNLASNPFAAASGVTGVLAVKSLAENDQSIAGPVLVGVSIALAIASFIPDFYGRYIRRSTSSVVEMQEAAEKLGAISLIQGSLFEEPEEASMNGVEAS